jgi:hypothetical protein
MGEKHLIKNSKNVCGHDGGECNLLIHHRHNQQQQRENIQVAGY